MFPIPFLVSAREMCATLLTLLAASTAVSEPSGFSAAELLPVWPRVKAVAKHGAKAAALSDREDLIVHSSGCCSELLSPAIERARRHIFEFASRANTQAPPLAHLRARIPGLREDSRPPEMHSCGSGGGRRASSRPIRRFGACGVCCSCFLEFNDLQERGN